LIGRVNFATRYMHNVDDLYMHGHLDHEATKRKKIDALLAHHNAETCGLFGYSDVGPEVGCINIREEFV
jgi:hypothetical protein